MICFDGATNYFFDVFICLKRIDMSLDASGSIITTKMFYSFDLECHRLGVSLVHSVKSVKVQVMSLDCALVSAGCD